VACFAHARRKFNDALEAAPVQAGFMLRLIAHLYRMERDWDERNLHGAERARRRTKDFEVTLRLLKKAALLLMRRALPQSGLGKACRYLLGQWDALVAHCGHGDTRIDTNLLENAIRPSAIPTPATAPRSFTRLSSPASAAASIPSTTSAMSSCDCRR
jgi:transposase